LNALGKLLAKGVFFFALTLSACGPSTSTPRGTSSSPELAPKPATSTVAVYATQAPIKVWISASLPMQLSAAVIDLVQSEGSGFALVDEKNEAQIRVEPNADTTLSIWVFALVSQFPTLADSVEFEQLKIQWQSDSTTARFMATPATAAMVLSVLGNPGQDRLQILQQEQLLDAAWQLPPPLAIVPFDALNPQWKVLAIDGSSPISKDFDQVDYPLVVPFGLSGEREAVERLAAMITWPASNRLENKLTVLVMTGVTALVRATAWRMEVNGIEYPGELIRDWLVEADITHISNEVSFAVDCPPADPYQASLRFCSQPAYSGLLSSLDIDLVELTGNHLLDWGADAFMDTLDLYEELGIAPFAGGRNLNASVEPLIIEHNGNRLAFLGCNAAGPVRVWATVSTPGAAPCSNEVVYLNLEKAASEGFIPIFTYQWKESKRAGPLSDQVEAFRRAIDSGAVIVHGSQAHQPQTLEFYQGRLIHYGLGNLFFDQMENIANRREFIDRHIFYDGRHISTELLTAMLEDFSQPRPMSEAERKLFLAEIFAESGW
jgi:poly-gamma-glutamate synthesis protein (capsule biosynthesis protein)